VSGVQMMATLLLADAAQAIDNKLYVLGGGWSVTGPDATPSALAISLKVPWDEANRRHELRVELVDSDGRSVAVGPTPEDANPVVIESHFEVGRPPGLKPGTPIDLALAVNVGPVPLAPGGRYEWRMSIDGHSEAHWHAAFSTRSPPDS
jgi:hypothetical protein